MPPSNWSKFSLPGRHPVVISYKGMIRRCFDKNCKDYARYGGRGISTSTEWLDMDQFIQDMLPSFFEGGTLDRIDNSKGYNKDNCRWVDRKRQANNRSNNRLIKNPHTGEIKTLSEWGDKLEVSKTIIMQRFHKLQIRYFTVLMYPGKLASSARVDPKGFLRSLGKTEDFIKNDEFDYTTFEATRVVD